MRAFVVLSILGALLLTGGVCVSAEEAPDLKVTPLLATTSTAIGQPISLPKEKLEVRASLFEIPVGAQLPVHKHPSQRYAYVLSGTLQVTDVENGRSFEYKPGDFIVEMVDGWHYGVNNGRSPVRLLVIDQVEKGQANTILKK